MPGYTHAAGTPVSHIGKVRPGNVSRGAWQQIDGRWRLAAAAPARVPCPAGAAAALAHAPPAACPAAPCPARQVSDDTGDVPDQTEGGLRGVRPKVLLGCPGWVAACTGATSRQASRLRPAAQPHRGAGLRRRSAPHRPAVLRAAPPQLPLAQVGPKASPGTPLDKPVEVPKPGELPAPPLHCLPASLSTSCACKPERRSSHLLLPSPMACCLAGFPGSPASTAK